MFSLAVLGSAAAGLILMSFGEQTYRDFDRRVLTAARDLGSGPPV